MDSESRTLYHMDWVQGTSESRNTSRHQAEKWNAYATSHRANCVTHDTVSATSIDRRVRRPSELLTLRSEILSAKHEADFCVRVLHVVALTTPCRLHEM